jgi:hypothetical protein
MSESMLEKKAAGVIEYYPMFAWQFLDGPESEGT